MCTGVLLHVSQCTMCMPHALKGRKRALDAWIDDCKLLCGCWDLNPDPLEQQAVSEPLSHLFSISKSILMGQVMREKGVNTAQAAPALTE